jgi:hypothetical protein
LTIGIGLQENRLPMIDPVLTMTFPPLGQAVRPLVAVPARLRDSI